MPLAEILTTTRLSAVPKFQHVRTGKVIDVSEWSAHRYRNDRYEELDEKLAQALEIVNTGSPTEGQQRLIRERTTVPNGTVPEVLEWAGDDQVRRIVALAAEKAGKNRKGIIEALS